MDYQLEKLSLDPENLGNGQEELETCPSDEHSEPETELCSCQHSELGRCSSVTEGCIAKIVEKLMTENKSREQELKAENEKLTSKLETAILDKEELKKQAFLANENLEKKIAQLEEEKRKIGEKLTLRTKKCFKSPIQCYYFLSEHRNYLHVSMDVKWDKMAKEPLLSSKFKIVQQLDGSINIFSTSSNKFLAYDNKTNFGLSDEKNFGLSDENLVIGAKFEFYYTGQDEKDRQMVKIRSVAGDGYLYLRNGYYLEIEPYTATIFTLVPTNQ